MDGLARRLRAEHYLTARPAAPRPRGGRPASRLSLIDRLIKSYDQKMTTKEHIVESALQTLASEGFAGATSRAIARRGKFNQALIFYHFGSLDALLLAVLDRTSEERLARFRKAVGEARTLEELIAVAARAYTEDRKSRHVAVIAQMVAGSVSRPELAPAVLERMEPWIELTEDALTKALGDLGGLELPVRELAYAVTTFYLGVNLLTHLDADRVRADALFARLETLAPALASLVPAATESR
jgi:AcrR family transcriptional regulator